MINLDWSVIPSHFAYLMTGLQWTLIVSALTIFFGFILGILIGLAKISRNRIIYGLATAYIEAFRGTPLLVQIFMVYLGLPSFGIYLDALTAGLIALSMNTGAYQAEIFRGGVQSIPKGQMEAARSLGMTYNQSMFQIVIPQGLRNSLPAYTNEFITMIKDSSLVSIIGVVELLLAARIVMSETFQQFVILIFIAVMYFIITFSTGRILRFVERKYAIPGMMGSE